MARKPYHAKLANDWFLKQPHFIAYMIREFTCVAIGIYVLNLMAGIVALAGSQIHWAMWLAAQRNPVMLLIALVTLAASIYHTYTFFAVTPKVYRIPKGDQFVEGKYIVGAHWAAFGVVAVVLFAIVASCA